MSQEERKDIELFFHSEKGYKAWAEISEDIVSKMDPVGWVDAANRRILDRVGYAKAWTVRKEFAEQGSIFLDDGARKAYSELYKVLASLPAHYLLTQITCVQLNDKTLVLRVMSDEVIHYIEGHVALYKKDMTLFNHIKYEKRNTNK